jgi:hypothetical protein
MESTASLPVSLESMLMLFSHTRRRFPSGFFLQISSPDLCMHFSSAVRATCPAHLIHLDSITRISFGEEYEAHRYVRNLLHSPITSFFPAPFSRTPSANVLNVRNRKQASKLIKFCVLVFILLDINGKKIF